jgi:hypothetical protein
MKTPGLLKHFLEFDLLVVLHSELLRVRLPLASLLKLDFEALEQLTTFFEPSPVPETRLGELTKRSTFPAETMSSSNLSISSQRIEATLQFIATLYVRDVTTLEGSQVGVQLLRERCSKINVRQRY